MKMNKTSFKRKVDYSGPGIYALYNVVKNKIYIGRSKNIKRRIQDHVRLFKEKKSEQNPMYSDNIEDFAFMVLHKQTEKEYETYGTILEHIYMNKIADDIPLYNVSVVDKQFIYFSLEYLFGVTDNINKSFRKFLGMTPCMLKENPKRRFNAFINRAIDEAMERDRRENNVGTD